MTVSNWKPNKVMIPISATESGVVSLLEQINNNL